MKTSFIIRLEKFEIKQFTETVKSMWDYAKLAMVSLRFMQFNYHRNIKVSNTEKVNANAAYIKLDLNASRLYIYISIDKYISFVFPFNVKEEEQSIRFFYLGVRLNEKLISEISTVIESQKTASSFIGKASNSIIDLYLSNDDLDPVSDEAYFVVERLISTEPGYLRHDHDPQSANGKIHPEFHFDVNFSQNATFKYGLLGMLPSLEFETMFDKKSNCLYIDLTK